MIARLYLRANGVEPGATVDVDREQAAYLLQVLRLRHGDGLQVFNGNGRRWSATLSVKGRRDCQLVIGEPASGSPPPSPVAITLAQGLAAGDRMDWIIEKATELGVRRIVPLRTAKTSVKLADDRAERRMAHWHRIGVAACMQSGRDDLPELRALASLADWMRAEWTIAADPAIASLHACVLDPGADTDMTRWLATLAARTEPPQHVCVLVGPESGLSHEELALAANHGFVRVKLGARVLRTETAGAVAVSLIQGVLGDLAYTAKRH